MRPSRLEKRDATDCRAGEQHLAREYVEAGHGVQVPAREELRSHELTQHTERGGIEWDDAQIPEC